MNGFEFYSGLQYRVKAQARIIREFESGERYLKIEEKHEAAVRERDRIIRRLEKELAEARQEPLHVSINGNRNRRSLCAARKA